MDTVRALLLFSLYIFFAAFQLFAIFSSNVSIFISIFSLDILKRQRVGHRERGLQSQQRETKKERDAWGSFTKDEEVSQG